MNILIVGCERVGITLAETLLEKGHDIAVLDKSKSSLELLGTEFAGLMYCGIPIDTEVLREAGISSCDAVCAVTEEENTNIMVSEIAKSIYNVPVVLARVFDPAKGDMFRRYGIRTVCSPQLTVDAVCAVLDKYEDEQYITYENARFRFYTFDLPEDYVGLKAYEIDYEEGEVLYAIIREDGTIKLVNNSNIEFIRGDKLILSRIVS